jgi:ADP-ribosylglycohydrolase
MLMLCDVFIRGRGEIRAKDVAEMLVAWSERPEYDPHFAGPSTRAAIERLKAGADPIRRPWVRKGT